MLKIHITYIAFINFAPSPMTLRFFARLLLQHYVPFLMTLISIHRIPVIQWYTHFEKGKYPVTYCWQKTMVSLMSKEDNTKHISFLEICTQSTQKSIRHYNHIDLPVVTVNPLDRTVRSAKKGTFVSKNLVEKLH